MKRRDAIVFLLDHWADIHGPGTSDRDTTTPDDGERLGIALTSSMAEHPSVVELARCRDLLRRTAKRHALHLDIYFGSGYMVRWQPKRSGNGKTLTRLDDFGHRVPVLEPWRVRAIPEWLAREPKDVETGEPMLVSRGIDFLSAAFRGEVFIPKPLEEAAGLRRRAAA